MKCMTGSWRAHKLSVGAEGYDFMFCSLNQNAGWDGSGIIPLLPLPVEDILECTIDAEKQNLIIGHCCLERTFNALLKKIRFHTVLDQNLMGVYLWESLGHMASP